MLLNIITLNTTEIQRQDSRENVETTAY